MTRKKTRKSGRKGSRRKEDAFGLGIPEMEIPSFNLGFSQEKKTTRSRKRENPFSLEIPKIETPPLDLSLGVEQRRIDPNKMPKVKLIGILSKQLSTNQIYQSLIRLGKHRLADEFLNEVRYMTEKYNKMTMGIDGKIEESREERLLKEIIEEIIGYIKRDFYREVLPKLKPKDEEDFSKQSLPFLAGVLSPIKSSFERLGVDIKIEREKIISERERIDLLITVGKTRIGIELKYNPTKMSEFDHLMSQIDRYIPYIDYLVIVSYLPLEPWLIGKIKEKEIEKGKPIKIVTPDKVI
ncbi:hypothetical protein DRN75_02040 [Nanoarchaeota archaeon]|nr:MAG: hypothetical protein DRN75_02040 [Nanoarchaeota archaeon]